MSVDSENSKYDSGHIRVLKGLEAVRARPGMYIGDTDDEHGSGLHHMINEVVHNSVDEALAGHCSKITVELCDDGSVRVSDDGRGIPIDVHKEEGVPAAELIMTVLHAGGKFNQNAYKVSGGLHGVGVSVVNALSDWLKLDVVRDGKHYQQMFRRGEPEAAVVEDKDHEPSGTGTTVQFMASSDTFSSIKYNRKTVSKGLRELAFLNRGINIDFIDSRDANDLFEENYHYEGGVSEFVGFLNENKTSLHDTVIAVEGEEGPISFELAMQWTNAYQEHVFCYTNNIPQSDGGTHLAALKTSLTRTVNKYVSEALKSKVLIQGDDVREGLTAVLSVKMPDPKFSSQTKSKLVSSEVKKVIELHIYKSLMHYFEENPKVSDTVVKKIEEASRAREAARKARDISRKTDQVGLDVKLSSKLADCQTRDPSQAEVFIVEGESAGGSAKQGRRRKDQAILPLKGKILNVEKARYDKILESKEIATLIMALGCGVGKDDYNPDKLRYHRVIIMTDADVDGAHIRTLLLTFFYRQMPELLERGHVYIAMPPLYRLRKGKSDCYIKDNEELYEFLLNEVVNHCYLKNEKEALVAGAEVKSMVINYYQMLDRVKSKYHGYPVEIFESMLMVPPVDAEAFDHPEKLQAYCERFNDLQKDQEHDQHDLEAKVTDGIIEIDFKRSNSEVDRFLMDRNFVSSGIYQRIIAVAEICAHAFEGAVYLELNQQTQPVESVAQTAKMIMKGARKGYTVQRYKGLGEMDAEQLWETTLDPDVRTLMQVTIEDAQESDRLFTMLMGDVVEPRKEFIEKNALLAENLDA